MNDIFLVCLLHSPVHLVSSVQYFTVAVRFVPFSVFLEFLPCDWQISTYDSSILTYYSVIPASISRFRFNAQIMTDLTNSNGKLHSHNLLIRPIMFRFPRQFVFAREISPVTFFVPVDLKF